MCTVGLVLGFVALAATFGAALLARWQWYGPDRRSSPSVLRFMLIASGVALMAVVLIAIAGGC